jgi:septation ring formation regulator EzrA
VLDNITVNVYLAPAELQSTLDNIVNHLKEIIMDQTQLAAELVALKTQNDKARAEVLAKLATLEAAIAAAGNTTAEVDAALADLKASVQTDDDIVPDDVVAP